MHRFSKKPARSTPIAGFFAAMLLLIAGCDAAPEPEAATDSAILPPHARTSPDCGPRGSLVAVLYGGIETELQWPPGLLACESMLRPQGEGIRLRFEGDVGSERLVFIIALPGLEPGATASELPANVTLTVEGSGRFFSTPSLDSCWVDIISQDPMPDQEDSYWITGELFCVGPLGEINGDASIMLDHFRFTGVAAWGGA